MDPKKKLEEMLKELSAIENAFAESAQTVELDQSRVGRLSRMDALQQQAISADSNRRRSVQIKRVTAALKRIEDGVYGDCLDCGEVIAAKRLEVDPATVLCIGCANKAEKRR